MPGTEQEKRANSPTFTATENTRQSEKSHSRTLVSLEFGNFKWRYFAFYLTFLVFCNVLVPCLLYYLLLTFTSLSEKAIIGISSGALGISSCFDAPFRLHRLVRYRCLYGPLNDDVWWHLDFFMWLYTLALFVFAFPLVIAPIKPLFNFFLMSTAILVGPVAVVFLLSLWPFRLPFWCSSDPPGSPMKPAVFYTIGDLAAVDFKHGREFRLAMNQRWLASPPFRNLMFQLTLYWALAMFFYVGLTATVTWASPLNFAYGWVLGQFFMWAAVAGIGSYWLTKRGLRKEEAWWASKTKEDEGVQRPR